MILCAAIKYNGIIFPGQRHDACIRTINSVYGFKSTADSGGFRDQGFIDEVGNYYDRKRAGVLAIKCGQIKKLNYHKEHLFSEDLY